MILTIVSGESRKVSAFGEPLADDIQNENVNLSIKG